MKRNLHIRTELAMPLKSPSCSTTMLTSLLPKVWSVDMFVLLYCVGGSLLTQLDELDMSHDFAAYWTSFATSGNPNNQVIPSTPLPPLSLLSLSLAFLSSLTTLSFFLGLSELGICRVLREKAPLCGTNTLSMLLSFFVCFLLTQLSQGPSTTLLPV